MTKPQMAPMEAKQAALLKAIELGVSRKGAAAAAGVAESTFYRWLEQPDFREAVRVSEGRFEQAMVARIRVAAAKGSWRAAVELLARRLRETWGDRLALDARIENVDPAERVARELSEEEVDALIRSVVGQRSDAGDPAAGESDTRSET